MTISTEMIDYALLNHNDLVNAYDFALADTTALSIPNLGTEPHDLLMDDVPWTFTGDGLQFNGGRVYRTYLTAYQNPMSGLLIFKRDATQAANPAIIYRDKASGSSHKTEFSVAGDPQSNLGARIGNTYVQFVNTLDSSDEFYFIAWSHGAASQTFVARGTLSNRQVYEYANSSFSVSESSLLYGGNTTGDFRGVIYAGLHFNNPKTWFELSEILDRFKALGALTVTTNLDSTRLQFGMIYGPTFDVYAQWRCEPGTSDISTFVEAESGTEVTFLAVDNDGDESVLRSPPVALTSGVQPSVTFSPVSSGGDPGTGLIAHIAGTVEIDGTAAERQVIVISDDPNGRQVLGEGMSAPDGTFDIEYNDWGGAVIALAVDNYGGDWTAETAIAAGTIIHPTTPNGYVYEATSGGTTGTGEPTWSINGAVNDGSVSWSPRPFYRPIASGPIKGEVLQAGTPVEPDFKITAIRLKDMYSQSPSQGYLNFAEVQLFDKAGNPVDLSGATASATSSHSNGSFPPFQAIDGDPATGWYNDFGVLPVTFEIQLLTATTISAIRLQIGSGDTYGRRGPSAFELEVIEEGGGVWILTDTYSGIDGNSADGYYQSDQQDGVFTVTEPV